MHDCRHNIYLGPETAFRKIGIGVNIAQFSVVAQSLLCCRTAYIHGLNFVTGDYVIIMDADFSHHVRLISLRQNA
jgi:glycosyltransferase involved in cell wall biosynthesis